MAKDVRTLRELPPEIVRRERSGGHRTFTLVDGTAKQMLQPAPRRRAIVLSSAGTALTYKFGAAPASPGDGIFVPANTFPLKIDFHWLGDGICQALFVLCVGASPQISVYETVGDDD
jgi:hypothetical protein